MAHHGLHYAALISISVCSTWHWAFNSRTKELMYAWKISNAAKRYSLENYIKMFKLWISEYLSVMGYDISANQGSDYRQDDQCLNPRRGFCNLLCTFPVENGSGTQPTFYTISTKGSSFRDSKDNMSKVYHNETLPLHGYIRHSISYTQGKLSVLHMHIVKSL